MPDNLIPQHVRLAMGEDIDVPSIENPFKQVSNVDKSDGKSCEMTDGQRKPHQKFGKYQG
jgi:hypothetical protein